MDEKKVSKRTLKTADRYIERMRKGEKLVRDNTGKIQWADGKSVGGVIIGYMMENGIIRPLDTDLFGAPTRGQTIGLQEDGK